MPQPVIALDVGGTHLRWATWSRAAGLGRVRRTATPSLANGATASADDLRAHLVELMTRIVPTGAAAGVSFGAALDHRTGAVYASAPLWGAHTVPFDLRGALTAARPDVRWNLVNDVTAALLHLAEDPVATDRRKLLLITVSTGVACRLLDRRTGAIPTDSCGLQGEIGHLPVTVAAIDLPCDCGARNHLASFASGPGLRRLAALRHPSVFGTALSRTVFEKSLLTALDAGDPAAREILRIATLPLADLVRTALCLDPELDLVAFTGGVARALAVHCEQALLGHLTARGLYLTSALDPGWLTGRLLVCAEGQADPLIGAGLATESAAR